MGIIFDRDGKYKYIFKPAWNNGDGGGYLDPGVSCSSLLFIVTNDDLFLWSVSNIPPSEGKESNEEETVTIPGSCDDAIVDKTDEPTYCKICAEVCEEMETSEDVFYHIMNNHELDDVLKEYGQEWIQARKYGIRKGSPFGKWKH